MLRYRLLLDVGTASLGLIALELDENNVPTRLAHHRLDIFSEPLLPAKSGGIGDTKNSARRSARLARRVHERRARRLRRIVQLAPLLGLKADEVPRASGHDLPRIRALAATQKISHGDLLNVMLNLSKRRGYRGGLVIVP
jgi:CRISPR-associated endonuclease Csn1